MNNTRTIPAVLLSICLVAVLSSLPRAEEKAAAPAAAGAIDAAAQAGSGHPEYEPGISCNDCHTVTYDAQTTATQVWLYEESPGKAKGEGVMPRERIWQEIVKAIGGIKHDSKTHVLGTSLNNVPLTTTCEWTLDEASGALYGFHEKGTEKLNHIAANSRVSMNYHKEFDSATFAGFLCVQIRGTAELIEGGDPRFEKIMIELLPYEYGAQVPAGATPEQREERLRLFRQGVKNSFVISKIIPEQIVITNGDFRGEGYRVIQRWTRD